MRRLAAVLAALLLAALIAWRLRGSRPAEEARKPAEAKPVATADPFAAEPAVTVATEPPPQPGARHDVMVPSFPESEEKRVALSPGLAWLARSQNADGSWGFGSEEVEGAVWSKQGATALALLAFFEAAYSHVSKEEVEGGTVGEVIKRGLKWMIANPTQGAFESAVAALAWGEGYALTNSAILKQYAVKEYATLMEYQGADGAWNADAGTTAWAAMAVRSARMGGLEVQEDAEARLRGWYETRLAAGGTVTDGAGWLCVYGAKDSAAEEQARAAVGTRLPTLERDLTSGLQAAWVVLLAHEAKSEDWVKWKDSVYGGIPAFQEALPPAGGVQGSGAVVRHALRQLMIESFFLYERSYGIRKRE